MSLSNQFELFAPAVAADVADPRLRLLVLDALGVGLAGQQHAAAVALRHLAPTAGEAQLIGGQRSDAISASAANAAAIHALDYDDTHGTSLIHVSSVLVPVGLALAEREDLSLERMLRGYAFGLRFAAFAQQIGPLLNAANYHATAVLGAVVAAGAGAWTLTENPEQAARAAELAAASALGLTVSFGTDAKPIQVGLAAANAARAALLAATDVTTPLAFTASDGLLSTLLGPSALERLRWDERCDGAVAGVVPKPYPCCYLIHGAIRAALDLRSEIGDDPIESAHVRIGPLAAELALKAAVAGDAQVARFSTEYCVGHALATGHLTLADFDDPLNAADQETGRIIRRLTTSVDPTLGPVCAAVTVRLRSGQDRTATFDPAAATSMSTADLVDKFHSNSARAIPAEWATRLEHQLRGDLRGASARALAGVLGRPGR